MLGFFINSSVCVCVCVVCVCVCQVEESDSVPYHSHHHVHGSGMRPALEPHPFSRSLSEEAHLAGIGGRAGGGYDSRLEEEDPQFSQDLPGQGECSWKY